MFVYALGALQHLEMRGQLIGQSTQSQIRSLGSSLWIWILAINPHLKPVLSVRIVTSCSTSIWMAR